MAFEVVATERFANQLRNAPGELAGYVSAVAAVLRVDPTVASAAFDVVRSGEEEYTAIFAHGRGFLIYWVPAGRELGVARRRTDIVWVAGTAASMTFDSEFDLAIMTGHAFQVLVGDDELRASLGAIRRALVDGGRFVFETRYPLARAWESWNPRNAIDVVDPSGRHVRVWHEVESVVGDVVTFTETTSDPDGARCEWTVPACASWPSTPSQASSPTPASRSRHGTAAGSGSHWTRRVPRS